MQRQTHLSERLQRSAVRFGAERVRKWAQWGGGGLRCALVLSGCENGRNTRKRAQFRNGYGRGLRGALLPSGCDNGRTTRKGAYSVRPGARAKIQKDRVKKRSRLKAIGGKKKKRVKNAKNRRVKIAVCVCLWANMSTTPVSGRWGGGK